MAKSTPVELMPPISDGLEKLKDGPVKGVWVEKEENAEAALCPNWQRGREEGSVGGGMRKVDSGGKSGSHL